jgi:hypothetical protein
MGQICCSETSVQNYHSTLRNIPEQRRSRLYKAEAQNHADWVLISCVFLNIKNWIYLCNISRCLFLDTKFHEIVSVILELLRVNKTKDRYDELIFTQPSYHPCLSLAKADVSANCIVFNIMVDVVDVYGETARLTKIVFYQVSTRLKAQALLVEKTESFRWSHNSYNVPQHAKICPQHRSKQI